jgi:hypothetical protein
VRVAAGSWAWVPDAKEMYIPGKVVRTFKQGEEGKFKLEDGKVRCMQHTWKQARFPRGLREYSDRCQRGYEGLCAQRLDAGGPPLRRGTAQATL